MTDTFRASLDVHAGFHLEKLARGGGVKSALKKGGVTFVKMRGVVT